MTAAARTCATSRSQSTSGIVNRAVATVAIAFALALAGAASAQQPTPAQQSAIKSACRGDYPKVCSNVQPGGPAALHCLQENAGGVSSGCQHALAALGAAPAPSAQSEAASSMAPGTAAPAGGSASAASAMAPAVAAPPRAPSGGGMSARDELRLTRQVCGRDYRRLCQGVQPGGGHAVTCLEANAASLSPGCRQALVDMKGHTGG